MGYIDTDTHQSLGHRKCYSLTFLPPLEPQPSSKNTHDSKRAGSGVWNRSNFVMVVPLCPWGCITCLFICVTIGTKPLVLHFPNLDKMSAAALLLKEI